MDSERPAAPVDDRDMRAARDRAEFVLAADYGTRLYAGETGGELARDVLYLLDATAEARERLRDGDTMGALLTLGWEDDDV